MPTLKASHEFLNDNPPYLEINLLDLESPEAWEGWINYEIKIFNGKQMIVQTDKALSMLEGDIHSLCEILESPTELNFEPTELDFFVRVDRTDDSSTRMFFALDEGVRRMKGPARSGVGIMISASTDDLKLFAKELRAQFAKLKVK